MPERNHEVTYERGRTMTYPTMYPRLLVTPVFAHRGDFVWVEEIVCKYDSEACDDEPEFSFHRDTARSERNDELQAENGKLRKRIAELEELLPENGRWFSAEMVEAYATECRALRTLAAEMFGEHQRIYHAGGAALRQTSATREQMARWYSECQRWGIEEDE